MQIVFTTSLALIGVFVLASVQARLVGAAPGVSQAPQVQSKVQSKVQSQQRNSKSRNAKRHPTIASVVPSSYQIQTPNVSGRPDPKYVTLLITGQNFRPKSVALWDGRGLATHFLSSRRIEASVPFLWIENLASHGSKPDDWHGSAHLVVRLVGRGSIQSNAVTFEVETVVVGG